MTCPKCQAAMKQRAIAGVLIDACAKCGGYWFDGEELDRYRSKLNKPRGPSTRFVAKEGQKPKGCPRCRVRTLLYGETTYRRMLRCTNCDGVFLTKYAVARLGKIRTEPEDEGLDLLESVIELVGSLFD